ncbi:MAG: cobalamin-dependent protein [Bradymonadales bacterium]|nr:cobalamin-dependent protein [Bradymonadales bacterium]
MKPLDPKKKLDIPALLQDLEAHRPRRRGWSWRTPGPQTYGKFEYRDMSPPLARSIGLPASQHFDHIDPQPKQVITTEIASGRFEDDLRRMRMAAWHGADHIMVIRTAGQSHFDGLIEGTPEGVGGVPITRKQLRASRRALDLVEEEVGRPINFHSYVSGVAGPEIAVLFVEEGVNGAHQDPQYNILYRNINMVRSAVDAAEAKRIMAYGAIFQIDGAHNANATAREAWCVMPELLVQHGINCAFSVKAGMHKENIGLSTVPPSSAPAPKIWFDLPYAVALRDFFDEYRFRAQQNTRYIESDIEEATRTHVIDTLISALTHADLQSTITPDEGRNVPWHYNNIRGIQTAKQTFAALDGIKELVTINRQGPLGQMVREIKERAVLFLEEIVSSGGYFQAVADGQFVDSARFPARNGDGIARDPEGGVAAGSVVKRDPDYLAPVPAHFGDNSPSDLLDLLAGNTLEDPSLLPWIDELDEQDNAAHRLDTLIEDRRRGMLKPEVEWHGDGIVQLSLFFPAELEVAEAAALEVATRMGLTDAQVIHKAVMHPAEGCYLEVKGRTDIAIDLAQLKIPEAKQVLSADEIERFVKARGLKVVGGTVGEDEHSVGLREILDIKHGGLEKFGFACTYLGTSVPPEKLVDAAIEVGAHVILASTIISHGDIHRINMRKIHQIALERGIRDKMVIIAGGTQVTPEMAQETGLDAAFGRGTRGLQVADYIVRFLRERETIR